MRIPKIDPVDRILDANINRAKEGLRVCEEIARFIFSSKALTEDLKKVRHRINSALAGFPGRPELLRMRDSQKDVGLNIKVKSEFRRAGIQDVFFANMQRVKESVRVLEEFMKLKDVNAAANFKKIRYQVYEIERRMAQRLAKRS